MYRLACFPPPVLFALLSDKRRFVTWTLYWLTVERALLVALVCWRFGVAYKLFPASGTCAVPWRITRLHVRVRCRAFLTRWWFVRNVGGCTCCVIRAPFCLLFIAFFFSVALRF